MDRRMARAKWESMLIAVIWNRMFSQHQYDEQIIMKSLNSNFHNFIFAEDFHKLF